MSNSENYKKAFSALHTSRQFRVDLHQEEASNMRRNFRPALTAICTAAAIIAGSSAVYAADLGGIQRKIQVWTHGEMTNAVLDINESDGTYNISDTDGNVISSGGGVAINADGSERTLSADEIADYIANEVTTETENGKTYLYYKGQKFDITDRFQGEDVCYLTLKDGDDTLYVTAQKNGGVATSPDRYQIPGKDFDTNSDEK